MSNLLPLIDAGSLNQRGLADLPKILYERGTNPELAKALTTSAGALHGYTGDTYKMGLNTWRQAAISLYS